MVYRNNAGRLGAGFISVCLETRWLGQKSGFYVPEYYCSVSSQLGVSFLRGSGFISGSLTNNANLNMKTSISWAEGGSGRSKGLARDHVYQRLHGTGIYILYGNIDFELQLFVRCISV